MSRSAKRLNRNGCTSARRSGPQREHAHALRSSSRTRATRATSRPPRRRTRGGVDDRASRSCWEGVADRPARSFAPRQDASGLCCCRADNAREGAGREARRSGSGEPGGVRGGAGARRAAARGSARAGARELGREDVLAVAEARAATAEVAIVAKASPEGPKRRHERPPRRPGGARMDRARDARWNRRSNRGSFGATPRARAVNGTRTRAGVRAARAGVGVRARDRGAGSGGCRADERVGRLRVDGRRDAEQGKYGSHQSRLTYGQTVWRRRARDARACAVQFNVRGDRRRFSARGRAPESRRPLKVFGAMTSATDVEFSLGPDEAFPRYARSTSRANRARQGGLGRELCRPRAALHRGCVASPPRAVVSARRGSSSRDLAPAVILVASSSSSSASLTRPVPPPSSPPARPRLVSPPQNSPTTSAQRR